MQIQINATNYQGNIALVPSKSYLHRAIICAFLANGTSTIRPFYPSEDCLATLAMIQTFQASYIIEGDTLTITSTGKLKDQPVTLDAKESATTLRLMMGLLFAKKTQTTFLGHSTLMRRPMEAYFNLCKQENVAYEQWHDSIVIHQNLTQTHFVLTSPKSSQFVSGLLLYLAYHNQGGSIEVINETSSGYIQMTIHMLEKIGVTVLQDKNTYRVVENAKKTPFVTHIEGDFSQLPVFMMMGALGNNPIRVSNVPLNSLQGDAKIIPIFKKMGANITQEQNQLTVYPSALKGFEVDIAHTPDLGVALIVLAAVIPYKSVIHHVNRLMYKESNRLKEAIYIAMQLGAQTSYHPDKDCLIIHGTKSQKVIPSFSSNNDHRIIFAIIGVSPLIQTPFMIYDAQAVRKSYPTFWEDIQALQGGIQTK